MTTTESSPSARKPIRLLVVDDHGLVRDSVSGMLAREDDLTVLGVAEDADSAIEKVLELRPELVPVSLLAQVHSLTQTTFQAKSLER